MGPRSRDRAPGRDRRQQPRRPAARQGGPHLVASLITEDVYWALKEHRQPDPADTPGG